MPKITKSSKKREWVQKGDHRKEIRSDEELFPYYRGHQTEKDLIQVAKDIIEWAKDENSLVLTGFAADRGMNITRIYEWMERSAELKEAWHAARGIIQQRRERGAMEGRYSSSVFLAKDHLYDDAHRAWKEKMSANSVSAGGGTVVVNMNKIESDIAPRKDEE